MGKIAEKKLLKQQRLLDTAFGLFTTQGVAKTSISDIANRAGMAKGTFYLYFRDKYDLEEKLIMQKSEEILGHALQKTDALAVQDFEEFLIYMVNDIIDQLEENPRLLRFINKNLSWGIFRRSIGRSDMNYTDEYYRRASEGPVTYENPELLLYTIIEFVSSTCYSLIMERDPVDMTSYKPLLNRSLRAVIRSYAKAPAGN